MTRLIKKKKLCTEITLTILALLLISAVVSAVLTRNAIVQKSELGNEVSALWITAPPPSWARPVDNGILAGLFYCRNNFLRCADKPPS